MSIPRLDVCEDRRTSAVTRVGVYEPDGSVDPETECAEPILVAGERVKGEFAQRFTLDRRTEKLPETGDGLAAVRCCQVGGSVDGRRTMLHPG
jgi:hypothetical protein